MSSPRRSASSARKKKTKKKKKKKNEGRAAKRARTGTGMARASARGDETVRLAGKGPGLGVGGGGSRLGGMQPRPGGMEGFHELAFDSIEMLGVRVMAMVGAERCRGGGRGGAGGLAAVTDKTR